MFEVLSGWQAAILLSALGLGLYDVCKKHAVRNNSVMHVLFLATLTGSCFFVAITVATHSPSEYASCSSRVWWLLLLKSVLVGSSWSCVYYAMRELPISIAAPIRATAPLWTFVGSLILYHEIPSWIQGFAMLTIFVGYYLFSVLGKLEGCSLRHRGMLVMFFGTLLGASSALYDKYLLGVLAIPRLVVQFWFCIDIATLLGLALLTKILFMSSKHKFQWRWTIPATGLLLIGADFLYFKALSTPEVHVSILSLMRRSSSIVAFLIGCWLFKDANVKEKALALLLIILGVTLLALF